MGGPVCHIEIDPATAAGASEYNGKMYSFCFAWMLALLISQFAVPAALAAVETIGSWAPGFTLETAVEHDVHHHQHVGTHADLIWRHLHLYEASNACRKDPRPRGQQSAITFTNNNAKPS